LKIRYALDNFNLIVTNGPLGTRLKYDYGIAIDEHMSIFDVLNEQRNCDIILGIFKLDLKIAKLAQVPIIINTLTYHASKNFLPSSSSGQDEIYRTNKKAIELIAPLRDQNRNSVILAAPIGSMYDSYSAKVIPSLEDAISYHDEQIRIFSQYDINYVNVITMPSLIEAKGIAQVIEKYDLEYTIGFKLDDSSRLLDGHNLDEAILEIDATTQRKPIGYLVYCTHASVMFQLNPMNPAYRRVIGVKANASNLSAEELVSSEKAIADSPEIFGNELHDLKDQFHLRILGGCCGTSAKHLEAILTYCK
jgi:homocysteine S-methyltransferase